MNIASLNIASIVRCCAVVALLLSSVVAEAQTTGWTYASKILTEEGATGTAWQFNATISGTEVSITSILTQGDNAELDFSVPVNGGAYSIVLINGLKNQKTLKTVRLPATIRTIAQSAFEYCPELEEVTPFLPPSLTFLGCYAFRGCPKLTGDLVCGTADTSVPFVFGNASTTYAPFSGGCNGITSATLNESCFVNSTVVRAIFGGNAPGGLTNVVIRSGAQSLADNVFRWCTNLVSVTLPETITSIGERAFASCPRLKTVTPFLPPNVESISNYAFTGCTELEGGLVVGTNGTFVTLGGNVFENCLALESGTFGPNVGMLGAYFFYHDQAMKEVQFYGDPLFATTAFNDWTTEQARFVIPADNVNWQAFYNNPANVTPAANFTPALTNAYNAAFPEGPFPIGYATFNNKKVWIVARMVDASGKHPLVVRATVDGVDVAFGTAEPGYGDYEDVAIDSTYSIDTFATNGLTLYRCERYVVDEYDPETFAWKNAVTNAGTAYVHHPATDGVKYRLSWVFDRAAYTAQVTLPDTGAGTVTETSSPDLFGFYTPGSILTLTAQAQGGAPFVRWYGDVPHDQTSNVTIHMTMTGETRLYPYFAANWVYSSEIGTMADGYWTLKVAASASSLTVSAMADLASPGFPVLDLAKPIDAGGTAYAVAAIGANAFDRNNRAPLVLEALILPGTLTSIGAYAFRAVDGLTSIRPYLPRNVAYIGTGALSTALDSVNPLYVGFGAPVVIGSTAFRYFAWYEIHFGPKGIAFSGDSSFQYLNEGTRLYWYGDPPTGMSDNTFGVSPGLKTIWYVPRHNLSWDAFLEDALRTPTEADLATFRATFPNETRMPTYKFSVRGMRGNTAWLVEWSPNGGSMLIIR